MKNNLNNSNATTATPSNHSPTFKNLIGAIDNFDKSLESFIDNIHTLNADECLIINKKFESLIKNLAFINNGLNSIYNIRGSESENQNNSK
jgi:hypothetical protein